MQECADKYLKDSLSAKVTLVGLEPTTFELHLNFV